MQTMAKLAMVLGCVGAMAIGSIAPASAYYISGPGFHVWIGPHRHYYNYYGGYGGGTWNGCPPDWTVQGGVCKPYRHGPWDYYGPRGPWGY